VALLREMTCNLRHPLGLRHSPASYGKALQIDERWRGVNSELHERWLVKSELGEKSQVG